MSFTILTDTSANLPKAFLRRHNIRAIPYTFMVDGRELGEDFSFEGGRFYSDMRRGHVVTTSQIPPQRYMDFFRSELALGNDVLFVSMSSGISGSYNSACIAAEELREEFPERKLRLVDALGASLGEGLLVVWAVRDRKNGLSVDETADRLLERRYGMCQVFTVDDLRYLKRGGRLSNLAAAVGTVLQIKPLLKGDNEGKIVCFDKLRGRRRAIEAMAEKFNACALPQPGQTIGIAHADCEEDMNYLISLLRRFREGLDIMTVCYEPVTGSHVGQGTLALFFEGSKAFR
ncbi:MAG: DegV family protein [Oscillospiraceae bacterium]|nr:DegV family protein [Oscillospiraceae bacterium]